MRRKTQRLVRLVGEEQFRSHLSGFQSRDELPLRVRQRDQRRDATPDVRHEFFRAVAGRWLIERSGERHEASAERRMLGRRGQVGREVGHLPGIADSSAVE